MLELILFWGPSFKIGFLTFALSDLLDILLVGLLLGQMYRLLRGTLGFNIVVGILTVYLLWRIVVGLEFNMLSKILGDFLGAGLLALIIIFAPEIRKFLFKIGDVSGIGRGNLINKLKIFLTANRQSLDEANIEHSAEEIMRALNRFSKSKTGALLAFVANPQSEFFPNSSIGVTMDAKISSKLLESIFDKHSPLHDGAVVISKRKLHTAGAVLPVSENADLPSRVGMRHRAAVGLTEQDTSAQVVLVSEERGSIAHAQNGKIRLNLTQNELREVLVNALRNTNY